MNEKERLETDITLAEKQSRSEADGSPTNDIKSDPAQNDLPQIQSNDNGAETANEQKEKHLSMQSPVAREQSKVTASSSQSINEKNSFWFHRKLEVLKCRTIAIIIDQMLCVAAYFFIALPTLAFYEYTYMIEISPFQHAWSNLLLFFWSGICYTVALLFWPYFYSAKFESSSWQATPGKLLMGLRVTSNKGDRLSFSTIVWKRIGQISVLFIVSLASILFSARLTLSFGKNSVLEFLVPASPFIACFILSLFSFKGKNLLNLFSNSVNRLDDAGRQEQRKRLRFTELCKTVMTTSTGKPEWLLLLCTAWACYAWYGTFAGCYQICSAMSEMNRAFANTQDERLIKQDSHYLQATSMVHNLGSWYYYLALLHKHTGDWPAARDELRKSIILSPNPTFAHNSLAMLLLERGELKSAASELEKSISWRNYYYQHPNYMIQPATQSELSLSQLKFGDHGSECAFPLSCLR